MVLSKGFSLITNALLDENRLQGLDEIGMEKKREKRRNSLQGPCKDVRRAKECLTEPDDDDFVEEKKGHTGYGFIKVNYYLHKILCKILYIIHFCSYIYHPWPD